MESVDEQLHDEHEQEYRCHLEEARQVHAISIARPEHRDARRRQGAGNRASRNLCRPDREDQLCHQQRCLHPLAGDHQDGEAEHPPVGSPADFERRPFEAALDFALHPSSRPPHVDGE
jgi:hypothetical protein